VCEKICEEMCEKIGEKIGEKRCEGKRETAINRVRSTRQTAENDVKHPKEARKCPYIWAFYIKTGRQG